MEFEYRYAKSSEVESTAEASAVSFAPDTLRAPTFFSGELGRALEFREAISALHDVVISDLRWRPKDKNEYKAWLARQELIDWAEVAATRRDTAKRLEEVRGELDRLRKESAKRMQRFHRAKRRYFDYLFKRDYDAWFVLDPVITVHPDEIFFECFSEDESSYGRLSVDYEVFQSVGELAPGTTNIDYSAALYDEFQKIRTYKKTTFEVDPAGFNVETGNEAHREVKIDLPESWVRGFLQVNSAMALPSVSFDLHPMDIHNLCLVLRRRKEILGPRAMRYTLKPDHPVRVVFEPWRTEVICPRSIYRGAEEEEIRVWGRRRIHILERLIPLARAFRVHLLGKGMPSFYVADLGGMSFTLGLSGWTANDWSRAGNFDLLAPRATVDDVTKRRVFEALKETWFAPPDDLAGRLGLDRAAVLGALSAYTQAGRAIFDINKRVYRVRELSREPLPIDALRFANEREAAAGRFLEGDGIRSFTARAGKEGAVLLNGLVKDTHRTYTTSLQLDADERIVGAGCNCNWYQRNRLRKGPCEHMLALRLKHGRQGARSRLPFQKG